jgi:hypothetical protein
MTLQCKLLNNYTEQLKDSTVPDSPTTEIHTNYGK